MFSHLSKLILVLSLVTVTGMHWCLLQSVAWFTMTVNFARTDPLPVALEKTFDGEHPCQMCIAVAEGKRQESKQAMQMPTFKIEFFFEGTAPRGEAPAPFEPAFVFAEFTPDRSDPPPVPPPRRA